MAKGKKGGIRGFLSGGGKYADVGALIGGGLMAMGPIQDAIAQPTQQAQVDRLVFNFTGYNRAATTASTTWDIWKPIMTWGGIFVGSMIGKVIGKYAGKYIGKAIGG